MGLKADWVVGIPRPTILCRGEFIPFGVGVFGIGFKQETTGDSIRGGVETCAEEEEEELLTAGPDNEEDEVVKTAMYPNPLIPSVSSNTEEMFVPF